MIIIGPSFSIEDAIDGEEILRKIERAGRTCYKSEDKITPESARAFVAGIIKRGHESVLEHEKVTVRIICDRGVTHEIVRHRIASYSQESTRYCNYGHDGEITVILPLWFRGAHGRHILNAGMPDPRDDELQLYKDWAYACSTSEAMYMRLIAAGQSPQQARAVLPNSLKTEIVCTFNLREWRHFFRLRTASSAHPQMREIICPLLHEFKRLIPVVFDDITEATA